MLGLAVVNFSALYSEYSGIFSGPIARLFPAVEFAGPFCFAKLDRDKVGQFGQILLRHGGRDLDLLEGKPHDPEARDPREVGYAGVGKIAPE